MPTIHANLELGVRALRKGDLNAADRVMRRAFGTFIGLPDPATFMGDAGFVHSRWRTDPSDRSQPSTAERSSAPTSPLNGAASDSLAR